MNCKYQCSICGWIYEPEIGDPTTGIRRRTIFEDLPDNWTCPVCAASKSDFKPLNC
ncbi:MAG: rubredoxin [Candidatus Hermodarchaeota archaeon]